MAGDTGNRMSTAASMVPASNSASSWRRSPRTVVTSMRGASRAMAAISGGSSVASSASRIDSVKRRSLAAGSKRVPSRSVRSKPCNAVRTSATSVRASGVGTMPCPRRSNSGSSNSSRSRPSAWLTAGCVRLSVRAAAVMPPSV
nr:hypothetical protein RSP673_06485 [Ralstonia solanacearum P673]